MIVGIGTDLVTISRVQKTCEKQSFLERIYTEEERAYARGQAQSLAAMFAAKEAAAKALGTGFRGFDLCDVEVCHGELGEPRLRFHRGALRKCEELGVSRSHLSLTHEEDRALAFVILEKEELPCSC